MEQRLENFGTEKIFTALFVFFGVIICFMRPPYQLMDEINHLPRIWQISEGIFLSPTTTIADFVNGGSYRSKKIFNLGARTPADALNDKICVAEIPVSFLPDEFIVDANKRHYKHAFSAESVKNFLETPLNADEREPVSIPNTGVYLPPVYFPQAVAAFLGRVLNLNAGIIYYLMCLGSLAFTAACVYWSMKFLPESKPLIFLLAMMPMFIIEAASTSADAVTYGVCLLGTAWLLSLRKSTEKLSRAETFGLIILSVMLACSKSLYGTILLLYFLIPRERVGSLKKFLLLGAAILFVNLLVSLVWTELSVNVAGVSLYTNYHLGFTETNAEAQKIFVAEHPMKFFAAMLNSLGKYGIWYLSNFVGSWGFLWNVGFPLLFYILYLAMLIFFTINSDMRFKLNERLVMLSVAGISATAFFLFDYITWSPVGADYIAGVQGRYFIPIALMTFAAVSLPRPMRNKNLIALVFGLFSGVRMLLENFSAFY